MRVFENIKVFSVCDTFDTTDYQHLYNSLTEYTSPDSYIKHTIEKDDEVSSVLMKHYGVELGEEVLIEIDY